MKVIYLDTETTDLPKEEKNKPRNWDGVHLTELASLASFGNVEFSKLSKLPGGVEISAKAAEVSGLTTERCNHYGSDLQSILSAWVNFVDDNFFHDTYFVGHNLYRFDHGVIAYSFERCGLTIPPRVHEKLFYRFIDTKLLWSAWTHNGVVREHHEPLALFWGRVSAGHYRNKSSLQHILETIGTGIEQDHRALSDCVDTAIVFEHMVSAGIVKKILDIDFESEGE